MIFIWKISFVVAAVNNTEIKVLKVLKSGYFSGSGSFEVAIQKLSKKATKAMYEVL